MVVPSGRCCRLAGIIGGGGPPYYENRSDGERTKSGRFDKKRFRSHASRGNAPSIDALRRVRKMTLVRGAAATQSVGRQGVPTRSVGTSGLLGRRGAENSHQSQKTKENSRIFAHRFSRGAYTNNEERQKLSRWKRMSCLDTACPSSANVPRLPIWEVVLRARQRSSIARGSPCLDGSVISVRA